MFAWTPQIFYLVYHFACLVDANMIYYLIGYRNTPLIEMVVTKYKESQENYVFHLIKLFGVYYQTNVSLADVIARTTR